MCYVLITHSKLTLMLFIAFFRSQSQRTFRESSKLAQIYARVCNLSQLEDFHQTYSFWIAAVISTVLLAMKFTEFKVRVLLSKEIVFIYFNESIFKMMKNAFNFM